MKIIKLEIKDFRSIKRAIVHEGDSKYFVFVGGNSAGKSNLLRAINLFFNDELEPEIKFNPLRDLPNDSQINFSTISLTIQFSDDDKKIKTYIDKNHKDEFENYIIPITLRLNRNGNVQFSFTVTQGRKKTINDLIERIKEYVDCVYIPSVKDFKHIIDRDMMRKIVSATFQGFGKGITEAKTKTKTKKGFEEIISDLQKLIDKSGEFASEILSANIPGLNKLELQLPYDNLEDFLGKLSFNIHEEGFSTPFSISNVGSGVQAFSIYTLLRMVHEIRPKNTHKKSKFIWLIEEPETFMHHDLQRKTRDKLIEYSQIGHILITTHSPVYIDKSKQKNTYIVTKDNGSSEIKQLKQKDLLPIISGILGVKFYDFLAFNKINILVEGDTDRDILLAVNEAYEKINGKPILNKNEVGFIVCQSANSMPHFYATHNMFNQFAGFICLFDRDKAGQDALNNIKNLGANDSDLISIPESDYKAGCGIEDLVDYNIWEKILTNLDKKGLVTIHSQKGKIVDYDFLNKNRVEVKMLFARQLASEVSSNLTAFDKYVKLLHIIAERINSSEIE